MRSVLRVIVLLVLIVPVSSFADTTLYLLAGRSGFGCTRTGSLGYNWTGFPTSGPTPRGTGETLDICPLKMGTSEGSTPIEMKFIPPSSCDATTSIYSIMLAYPSPTPSPVVTPTPVLTKTPPATPNSLPTVTPVVTPTAIAHFAWWISYPITATYSTGTSATNQITTTIPCSESASTLNGGFAMTVYRWSVAEAKFISLGRIDNSSECPLTANLADRSGSANPTSSQDWKIGDRIAVKIEASNQGGVIQCDGSRSMSFFYNGSVASKQAARVLIAGVTMSFNTAEPTPTMRGRFDD